MTRKNKDLWEKFVQYYDDNIDNFDTEVYGLMSKSALQKAQDINNAGKEAQFDCLIKEGGPKFVKDLLEKIDRLCGYTRTLIRVEGIDLKRQSLFVIIPAWNPHHIVIIPFDTAIVSSDRLVIRNIIREWQAKGNCRVFAEVTLGAAMKEDLRFRAWSEKEV